MKLYQKKVALGLILCINHVEPYVKFRDMIHISFFKMHLTGFFFGQGFVSILGRVGSC